MSETVPGAIIMSSLIGDGPAFLPLPELSGSTDVVHVNGGAHAEAGSVALLVEFRTLTPDLQTVVPATPAIDPPATLSGAISFVPDQAPDVIAGALQQTS